MTTQTVRAVMPVPTTNPAAMNLYGVSDTDARHLVDLATGMQQKQMARKAGSTNSAITMRTARLREAHGIPTIAALISWAYQVGVLEVSRG